MNRRDFLLLAASSGALLGSSGNSSEEDDFEALKNTQKYWDDFSKRMHYEPPEIYLPAVREAFIECYKMGKGNAKSSD